MTERPDRIAQVKERGPAEVAAAFGADVTSKGCRPCPHCKEDNRSRHDKRRAVSFAPDGVLWICDACKAAGDAATLAGYFVLGQKPADRDWPRILEVCADRGLCEPVAARCAVAPWKPPARRVPQRPPPEPPPAAEVRALWTACLPVTADAQVRAWLQERGLDAATVADRDLARALPIGTALPEWAAFGRSPARPWPVAGYRVIVPMYGPAGAVLTVRARNVSPVARPKAVPPQHPDNGETFAHSAVVMAEPLAQMMLEGAATAAELVRKLGLWVTEGEPDFLTVATSHDGDSSPAVVGIISGSWTPALAAKVPDGTRVVIATHHDPPDKAGKRPGEEYAQRIRQTFAGRRVRLARWGASGRFKDVNDAHKAGAF